MQDRVQLLGIGGRDMSGYGYRNAVLQLDAALWRKRIIVEADSAEGRAAADAHQVPIELIGVVAARIAGYIARGEVVVSRRETIGALCGPGQARRVARYLAERGHVEGAGDLIRIRVAVA